MKHRFASIAMLSLMLVLVVAAPAFAANVAVRTCMPNKVSFDSLTDALQGVPAGSTIQVCPGTYAEQIVIVSRGFLRSENIFFRADRRSASDVSGIAVRDRASLSPYDALAPDHTLSPDNATGAVVELTPND